MEKICIAKRRNDDRAAGRSAFEMKSPAPEYIESSKQEVMSFALSPAELEKINRSGCFHFSDSIPNGFSCDCRREEEKMVFNFHFSNAEPIRMLKSHQVRLMLQIGKGALAGLIRSGDLKSYRIGRVRRFLVKDIMEYLSRCAESSRAAKDNPEARSRTGIDPRDRSVLEEDAANFLQTIPEGAERSTFRFQVVEDGDRL